VSVSVCEWSTGVNIVRMYLVIVSSVHTQTMAGKKKDQVHDHFKKAFDDHTQKYTFTW